MMSKIKNNYTCLASILVVFMFFVWHSYQYSVFPFGDNVWVNSDAVNQVYPMLCVLSDKLKSQDSILYFWCVGMGSGFLPVYFFFLSSPFYFFAPFFDENSLIGLMSIVLILKMVLSSGSFALFLTKRNKKNNSVYYIPLSCAYALSSYMIGCSIEPMWMDCILILPIILLGYERLVVERKPILYILSLAICSFCNFYFTYITALFLVLWFILDDHKTIKDFLKNGLLFALSSLVAMGMTAVSLLISFGSVNGAYAGNEGGVSHEWYGNIFEIIRYQYNFSNIIGVNFSNNKANIYCGLFSIVFCSLYLFCKNIKLSLRIKRVAMLFFLIICMNESILNYVWHGFHKQIGIPNRFSYLFVFLMLLTSADVLDNIKTFSLKRFLAGMIISISLPMVTYFFVDFDSVISSKQLLVVELVLIFLYSIFLLIYVSYNKRICAYIFSILMIFEILINTSFICIKDIYLNKMYVEPDASISSAIQQIKSSDDKLFNRIDFVSQYKNLPAVYDMKGFSCFSSLMSYQLLKFCDYMGFFTSLNTVETNGVNIPIAESFGNGYLVVNSNDKVFENIDYYTLSNDSLGYKVYKQDGISSVGFAANKNVCISDYGTGDVFSNINKYVYSNSSIENIFEEYVPGYQISFDGLEMSYGETDHFCVMNDVYDVNARLIDVGFDAQKTGVTYIYISSVNYNSIKILVNNELVREYKASNNGMVCIGNINEGDYVETIITSDENVPKGMEFNEDDIIEIRIASLNEERNNEYLEYLKSNSFKITEMNSSDIKGTVKLDKDQILFTSIPYDEGWHIYENGKEVKKLLCAGAFLGCDLGEGEHNIELKYIPKGLYAGIVVTIITWAFFLLFFVFKIQNRFMSVDEDVIEEEDIEEEIVEENG